MRVCVRGEKKEMKRKCVVENVYVIQNPFQSQPRRAHTLKRPASGLPDESTAISTTTCAAKMATTR